MKTKSCGREPSCELVLEHSSISRFHARIELDEDGLVCVQDTGSNNGTFLNRNDSWIRVKRATLCIGDRFRFGEVEVPLERLTAVFGKRANVKLEARHFPLRQGKNGTKAFAAQPDHEAALNKPRRNPVTGKIEEINPN